jgi:hypothetical protein
MTQVRITVTFLRMYDTYIYMCVCVCMYVYMYACMYACIMIYYNLHMNVCMRTIRGDTTLGTSKAGFSTTVIILCDEVLRQKPQED